VISQFAVLGMEPADDDQAAFGRAGADEIERVTKVVRAPASRPSEGQSGAAQSPVSVLVGGINSIC
jgi:hypothetical protein